MSPGSRLTAGIRYSEVFLFMASTSANRLGSKVAGEIRTNAVAGSDSITAVIGSLRVEEPPADAPTPRAHALAILENFLGNLRAVPAMAILGSLLAEEERHPELLHLFKTRLVQPRRALLRQALAAGDLPASADLDALTSMLIGSFYGRYVTIAGIPDDWPDRVLSAVWPPDGHKG
jgi:tetracycline repressor-like protein